MLGLQIQKVGWGGQGILQREGGISTGLRGRLGWAGSGMRCRGLGGGWQRAEARISQSGRRGGQPAQRMKVWGKRKSLPLPGHGEGPSAQTQGPPPASQAPWPKVLLINWHTAAQRAQARTGPVPITT